MQAAQLIHKTQMEPKGQSCSVLNIATDKQKEKINTGCDKQVLHLVLDICFLCTDHFVTSIDTHQKFVRIFYLPYF